MKIDDKLMALKRAASEPGLDTRRILSAMEDVLVFLVDNNTDENCRKVDNFVSTQIEVHEIQSLPDELSGILADMGGSLHDTHTDPEIAENFYSTPHQLFHRLQRFKEEMEDR